MAFGHELSPGQQPYQESPLESLQRKVEMAPAPRGFETNEAALVSLLRGMGGAGVSLGSQGLPGAEVTGSAFTLNYPSVFRGAGTGSNGFAEQYGQAHDSLGMVTARNDNDYLQTPQGRRTSRQMDRQTEATKADMNQRTDATKAEMDRRIEATEAEMDATTAKTRNP